jgi:hypothetical protein
MDGERFDFLTRVFATRATRRGALGGMLGGAAALAGAARGRGPVAAAPKSCTVACAGLPGPQKAACKQACRECGGDINSVCIGFGPLGPASFTCCPSDTFCDFETGQCAPIVECSAEICAGDPCGFNVCGLSDVTGVCLCAESTGADPDSCDCVQPICTDLCSAEEPACPDGFVCITQCCGEPTCAPRCGTALGAGVENQSRWG